MDHNQLAMRYGAPLKTKTQSNLQIRNMETRRFDTADEKRLLLAATQTLQDLGFTITESSLEVGLLVGSKQRAAVEQGQVAGQVFLSLLFGALGSYHSPTYDQSQKIIVTLVTTPIQNAAQTDVRVQFDRRITNNQGRLWRAGFLLEEKLYQEFFDKLSKSVFLEAHKL